MGYYTKLKVYITQKDIKNIDYDYNGTILIKIHGCITSKRTIATTLNRVSGFNSYDYRKRVIQNIFCGKNKNKILSMGYSYSDAFDITPAIDRCLNKKTQIYILGHKPEMNIVQSIHEIKGVHPIKSFNTSKIIATNFDVLIKKIWERFANDNVIIDKCFNEGNINNEVDGIVKKWVKEVEKEFTISAFYSMIAGIYIKVSNYVKSEHYFKKAISVSKENYYLENVLHYTTGLVMLLDNEGRYQKVIEHSQEMLTLINQVNEDNKLMLYELIYLEYQGKALQCLSKFEDAQELLMQAYEFSKILKNKNHEVFCMTLLATNYHNLNLDSEAIRFYKEAEKKYFRVGDITGLSLNHSELAKLYEENEDYRNAYKYLKESLSISKKINNKANIAIDLTDLGRVLMMDNKFDEAEEYYDDALIIFNEIDDVLGKAICINNYAFLKKEKGFIKEAIALHKEAVKIFLKFKYYPSLKETYECLSNIYSELNDSKMKRYYLNRSSLY